MMDLVSGNANRQPFKLQLLTILWTILTDFINNLSIFELNNLTNNK